MKTKYVLPFFFLLLLCFYSYAANKKNNSVIYEQIAQQDSIPSPASDSCDMCHGKGVIFVKCRYCGGTGNATYISEWRRKNDIDYWVCEHCRGMKGYYQKCPKCKQNK